MVNHSAMSAGTCLLVFLSLLSCSSVDAWWFNSVAGITSDIVKNPLESLSLFALKSYLLGHLGGRVTQYRQMMMQQYAAANNNNNNNNNNNLNNRQYVGQLYNQPRGQPTPGYFGNVHNRPRRDLRSEVDAARRASSEESERVEVPGEQFLEMAEKLDMDKCIPRLVCEVMAGSKVTDGSRFEDLVVRVFGDDVPEIKGDQKMFSSVYHYAAFAGKGASDPSYCNQLFPKCKASETEFRKMAEKIFMAVDDTDDDDNDSDSLVGEQ